MSLARAAGSICSRRDRTESDIRSIRYQETGPVTLNATEGLRHNQGNGTRLAGKGIGEYLPVFLVGAIIRAIPNLLTPYPIGFDTLYYMTQILDWRSSIANPNLLLETPLHFLILAPLHAVTGIDPWIILRWAQPIIYGLLAASFYYVERRLLGWEARKALLGVIFFSVQTVTLRISWDLLRNTLSLAILLFTLPSLKNHDKDGLLLSVLSVLVVLSHQMPPIILFSVAAVMLTNYSRRKQYDRVKSLLMPLMPSALLYIGVLLHSMGLLRIPYTPVPSIFPVTVSAPVKWSLSFPFVNHFIDYAQPYLYILSDVVSFYLASYLLVLSLVAYGFLKLREKSIDTWGVICAAIGLMPLVTPQSAIVNWQRWLMYLVVPYSIYAVHGLSLLTDRLRPATRKKIIAAVLSIYMVVAVLYMTSPTANPVSTYAVLWPASKFSPATMMANTVPVQDTQSTIQAIQWLNQAMKPESSCLIAREVFVNWAKINLRRDATIVHYAENLADALTLAQNRGYTNIYWIWWIDKGTGQLWYGQPVPTSFIPIHREGNIAVYKYSGP
jgi:hypothetical protein